MTQHDWSTGAHALGFFLNGDGIAAPGPEGERVQDDSFLLLFNASAGGHHVQPAEPALRQAVVAGVRHGRPGRGAGARRCGAGGRSTLTSRSLVLLRRAD